MAKLTDKYNLSVMYPDIAKEWHPIKNGNLTPRNVTPYKNRKIWWQCSKGHEWQAVINSRSRGNSCPCCSGYRASKDHCLKTANPSLAKQWHPTRNGKLTPIDVTPHSNKKVWWLCNKGHEWQAIVNNRIRGRGCPYCYGFIVCKDNCLATVNSELAKQWHPTRNGKLTPKDVTAGSSKKIWWKCKNGHVWQATVTYRSRGTGCPKCRYINSQVG